MAIDYTNASTGLFTHIGKLVKYYNIANSAAGVATLDAELQAIMTAFQAGSQALAADGLPGAYEAFRGAYVTKKAVLANYALRRLQDSTTVLSQLDCLTDAATEIFDKLITQMIADTKTVQKNTVTIGTVTAGGSNVTNGSVLTTAVLDGYSSPGANAVAVFSPHLRYKGVNTELAPSSDTMLWTVIADSFTDGLSEGSERIFWNGDAQGVPYEITDQPKGSGSIGAIQPLQSYSLLQNLDFETFASNAPSSWTIDTGTAGTHVYQETGAANLYHGASSLRFKGDGALASIQISQAVAAGLMQANRAYCVSVRVKADATIAAGQLVITFAGTGYTAGSSEKITIAPGSLPTSWTLYNFFVNAPAVMPSDWKLSIQWSGTPTNNKNVYVDDIGVGPVNYGAGIGAVAVRGSTPFVRGDRWTASLACDGGVFQKFFRDAFGYQLPSSASPNIADSLAT